MRERNSIHWYTNDHTRHNQNYKHLEAALHIQAANFSIHYRSPDLFLSVPPLQLRSLCFYFPFFRPDLSLGNSDFPLALSFQIHTIFLILCSLFNSNFSASALFFQLRFLRCCCLLLTQISLFLAPSCSLDLSLLAFFLQL